MPKVQINGQDDMDTTILILITVFFYIAISSYQFMLLKKHNDNQSFQLALFAALPLLSHGWLLHVAIDTELGQNLSIFNIFSMMFWLIAVLIIASSINKKLGVLVMTILPITALSLLASYYFGEQHLIDASAPGYLLHTLISIASISVISLAAIQSIFVSNIDNQLKQLPTSSSIGMPSLQDMEKFLYVLIWSGFILLSLSILTAILFMPRTGASMPLHKPILSISSWLVFATFLVGRYRKGWRGKTAAKWTISGFVLVFLAYFGTRTILELVLGQ